MGLPPSTVTKTYPQRGPLQQLRFAEATAFRCFRCGSTKKSKLITIYASDWSRRLCNGCYGHLLSLYEIKTGTNAHNKRAEELAVALNAAVAKEDQRHAERVFRASEKRAEYLSPETVRFVATAEHVARQLQTVPHLEWSLPVIGLCKAVESEVVNRILVPLANKAISADLSHDKKDKDIGRVATFCIDSKRKPPELGVIAHFLQTVIHSSQRRRTSPLIRIFLTLVGDWTDSNWLLDSMACHRSLTTLTTKFRNPAAHIEELGKEDYIACRNLVIGDNGIIWSLLVATERHRLRSK